MSGAGSSSEDDVPLIKRRVVTGAGGAPTVAPQGTTANGSAPVAASKPATAASKPTAPPAAKPAGSAPASGKQDATAGSKPAAAAATKPAVKTEPKAAVKTEPAGASKPEPKAAAKAEPKPAVKPEPKSPAKPSAQAAKPAAKQANGSGGRQAAKRRKDDSDAESSSSSEDASSPSSSDADSDRPLSQRRAAAKRTPTPSKGSAGQAKRVRKGDSKNEPGGSKTGESMWRTLEHAGVMFPPDYVPHGVKMLYEGKPVELTPEQEEVASMYAIMKDSDYCTKPVFIKNFFDDFKKVLGPKHVIKSLDKCDFTPMYDYFMADKETKKARLKADKEFALAEKKSKAEACAKFTHAKVDGRIEPVGNFRVEPPGLFRGRGEHPRMGKVKQRIYPKDIVINIGEGVPIPQHPYPGQTWKEIRHDHTVTWLAYWKDTISDSQYKYVFLGATSSFKAESDLAKYERARKLKGLIHDIRRNYEQDWDSKDIKRRQMGVAMYFVDKLALRAGHEKDEDEADTVGCCTLKCENVELVPPRSIKFDFLGKDSIRYENTVEVHPKVYANVEKFKKIDSNGKRKDGVSQLFETFDAGDLNKNLKNIMDGLSVKVFRTYNASITLDRLLTELEDANNEQGDQSVDQKKADYDKANKEVAILCNHQRSVPKTHGNQIEKLQEKIDKANQEIKDLEDDLRKSDKPDSVRNKLETKRTQVAKLQLQMASREDLKTVALGTSKINYMDPRITVAWCKRNEVPIEKIFNKSLLAKFYWAMDVEPEFKF